MSIKLQSISVTKGRKNILNTINLVIRPDELTLLIGPNGAGKSTLLEVCCGDLAANSGNVIINNEPINTFSIRQLATTRAVMTQSYEMGFGFTVREIVAMGCFIYNGSLCQTEQQKIIQEVMYYLDIEHLAKRSFLTLSGGEQQRAQLARVLSQLWAPYEQSAPRYLFLDEPTSSLDIFHQYHVLSLAKKLTQRNIGVLAVVHDLSLAASIADKLVLLSKGEIITQGKPESVLQRDNLLRVYGIDACYFHASDTVKPSVLLGA